MESPTLYTLNTRNRRLDASGKEQGSGLDSASLATILQSRLRSVEQSCNAAWWEFDLVTESLTLGEQALRFLGWQDIPADGVLEKLLAAVPVGDRDGVRARFGDLAHGFNANTYVFRVTGEDGTTRTLRMEETTQRRVAPDSGHLTVLGTLTEIPAPTSLTDRAGPDRPLLEAAELFGKMVTWKLDADTGTLSCLTGTSSMFGFPPGQTVVTSEEFSTRVHPGDLNRVITASMATRRDKAPLDIEYRFWNDSSQRWMILRSASAASFSQRAKEQPYQPIYGFTQDISIQRADEERLRQAVMAFEYSRNMVFVADATGCITQANRVFYDTSGYLPEEVENTGRSIGAVLGLTPDVTAAMQSEIGFLGTWRGEVEAFGKGSTSFPLVLAAAAVKDAAGAIASYVYVGIDISAERAADEQIRRLAFYDTLTGLPNRLLIRERAEAAIRQSQRQRDETAVLYLDLDHFKHVNDSLGHAMGDELLREVSRRLQSTVRSVDSVARLSGDEFLIVLPGSDNKAAAIVAGKLVDSLCAPIRLNGNVVVVGVSVGISMYPHDADDYEELLRTADMAMYRAKEGGRNGYRFYTSEMDSAAQRRIGLTHDLRQALPRKQLEIHYQPILQLEGQTVLGVEALLRWRHPERGLVSPMEFIPLAEEAGLIDEIGSWVIGEACRQNVGWHRDHGLALTVSINCSARQLQAPEKLLHAVRTALSESGLPAARLELEITESMVLDEADRVIKVLSELRAIGIKLAIDDFGTGYSNLGNLKRMPIDKLKIDRSFVRDLADDGDRAIAATIVALARTLGLTVIAEGVENDGQLDLLTGMGCDQAQGFLWSTPLPETELVAWLRQA